MKNIRIIRLTLDNFKCHKHLELALDGRDVSIYGDNATGKTSIYDALTWLLFGKDSTGNGEKNVDIKPLDATGAVADHQAITSVEALFSVDGEGITLKRSYREIWSTKRGSSAETYDGNTSDYAVDGVPCKKLAYDAKIAELVSEDVFRLLTSVSYFASTLPWQKRRELLFDMAGTMSDQDIMAQDAQFALLRDGMGKLSLEDYRKKLTAEKKRYTGIKSEVPARLNECQKTLEDLAGMDFDLLRQSEIEAKHEMEELNARLRGLGSDLATEKLNMDLREARVQLDQLEAANREYKAKQLAGMPDTNAVRANLAAENRNLAHATYLMDTAKSGKERCEKAIAGLRDKWAEISGRCFTASVCPTCGQVLPADQLAAARDKFEAARNKDLQAVEADAARLKDEQAQMEQRIEELTNEISGRQKAVAELDAELKQIAAQVIAPSDMDGYARDKQVLTGKIADIQGQIADASSGFAAQKAALSAQISAVADNLRELQRQIAKEGVVEYTRQRVDELRKDARAAALNLEQIEQMLYLMDTFTRHKVRFVEDGINARFALANIRLYREQANGGVEDRCDVTYCGVPYTGLNNGAKINVGMDIIRTLSRHYGVSVPLFVDNAESITRLESCGMQTIRLVVSEMDKELRISYEN